MIQIGSNIQPVFSPSSYKHYRYADIIFYLDNHWSNPITSLEPLKNILLGIDKQILSMPTITVAGTNGKTITNYFLTTLFQQENIRTGSFTSPHFTDYNEQITFDGLAISNQVFTRHAIVLLTAAEEKNHHLHAHELLIGITLLQAREIGIDLLIIEQKNLDQPDPVQLLTPRVIGITRLLADQTDVARAIDNILKPAVASTFVLAADQSKANLHHLHTAAAVKSTQWQMPIRKIARLAYPYEQIHGRCATLAEKIATIYMAHFAPEQKKDTFLHRTKKHRGRPTLEQKKQDGHQLYKTMEQFWAGFTPEILGRFQLIQEERATILLDCADSIDAFKNLFLGIRLLAYKENIRTVTFIIGSTEKAFDHEQFIKLIRYFFKKTPGQVFFCPVTPSAQQEEKSWNPEQLCNIAKNIKIKSSSYNSFADAFFQATQQADVENLVVITGHSAMITEYIAHKKRSL